jgi:hypothetical protein
MPTDNRSCNQRDGIPYYHEKRTWHQPGRRAVKYIVGSGYFDNRVGVFVIRVLIFTVFYIVCTVFLYCLLYAYLFLFVLSVLV